MSNRRLIYTCTVCLICNILLLSVFIKLKHKEVLKYYISLSDVQQDVIVLPDDFLSFGIDTSKLQNVDEINFSDPRLHRLVGELAPARLRLGGTMSERLIFSKEDLPFISCDSCNHKNDSLMCFYVKKMCKKKFLPYFLMTGSKWIEINEFCKATNLKLLFSLNVLLRNETGWIDTNAKELISFTKFNNFKVDWQLGNEPNSFTHTFNATLYPKSLSNDFRKLRLLLNEYGMTDSLVVGPDTTRPLAERPQNLKYMMEFLGNGSRYIDVRSWHQYYLNSRTATLEDFWNPDTFNLLNVQIFSMKNNTAKYNHIPMWLSETSSSYGGGAPGLSNSYAGTPLWVDKLGLAAKNNITTVIRQSLLGGNYSLIDEDLNPLPDWWVSVLYKKVVGSKVLNIDVKASNNQRFYVHCANKLYTNDTSAVTIYGINLKKDIVKLLLNGSAIPGDNLCIDEFIISSKSHYRQTKTILLNGWPLEYGTSELEPRRSVFGNKVMMPPYSIAFWVIKNTRINACKN